MDARWFCVGFRPVAVGTGAAELNARNAPASIRLPDRKSNARAAKSGKIVEKGLHPEPGFSGIPATLNRFEPVMTDGLPFRRHCT
jgi:hypothetical protein